MFSEKIGPLSPTTSSELVKALAIFQRTFFWAKPSPGRMSPRVRELARARRDRRMADNCIADLRVDSLGLLWRGQRFSISMGKIWRRVL
jgi:hypothetical protein